MSGGHLVSASAEVAAELMAAQTAVAVESMAGPAELMTVAETDAADFMLLVRHLWRVSQRWRTMQ